MRTSEQINEIAAAMAAAQSEFPAIKKSRTAKVQMKAGGQYSYAYADLADIIDAVRPILAAKGLAVAQAVGGTEQGFHLTTRLMHGSGQWLESDFPLRMAGTIQEVGSELTYVRRYALCGILGVAAEEDDDGNAAKQPTQQQRKPAPAPAQRQEQKREAVTPTPEDEQYLIRVDEAFDAREAAAQVGDPAFTFTREDRRVIRSGAAKRCGKESVCEMDEESKGKLIRKIVDGDFDHFRAATLKKQPVAAGAA